MVMKGYVSPREGQAEGQVESSLVAHSKTESLQTLAAGHMQKMPFSVALGLP